MSTSPEQDIKELKAIYDKVEEMVKCDDYDKDLQEELAIEYPDYMNVLQTAKRDLVRNDCGIIIAGETSAGKSTLINNLVDTIWKKPLFKSRVLAATAAITRIHNSEEFCIKSFTKDEVLIKEERCSDKKALRSAIQNLTDLQKMSDDMKRNLHYLDVYLPVPILKGNVIIVDTPGIGEVDKLYSMLLEFLQHAVAFVFVVNARNAGGITRDGLCIILKTVMDNRHKMPCFDMKDALFLTNQWDSIEADNTPQYSSDTDSDTDSSEEESEIDMIWTKVKTAITDKWRGLPEENIFKTSLKQVQAGKSTKYTKEYERFECKLNETIAKNMNKRVQFYFEFIQRFQRKAVVGTLARLKLLERSEEEQMKIMEENGKKIYQLKEDCKERRRKMLQCKHELVNELTEKLNSYLRSPAGRYEILNPPGECEIGNVSYKNVTSEVGRRLENGIYRWCEKKEAKEILGKADKIVRGELMYIESQLRSIEVGLLGLNAVVAVGISGFILDLGFTFGLLIFPFSIAFAIVVAFVLGPVLALFSWFISAQHIREMAFSKYDTIMKKISIVALKKGFDDSIGKELDRIISEIFDDAVPKKIRSFLTISRKLQDEYKSIKAKQESIMRLKYRISNIGDKIEKFRNTCGSQI